MQLKPEKYKIDLFFIATLGSIPIWMFSPANSFFVFGQLFVVIICTFFSFAYLNKIRRYLLVIFVSIIAACATATFFLGDAEGWILLFYLLYIKLIIFGAIAGYVCALGSQWLFGRLQTTNKGKKLLSFSFFIIVSITFISVVASHIYEEAIISDEIHKRTELTEYVVRLIGGEDQIYIDTKYVIESGAMTHVYDSTSTEMKHGYGGNIEVSTSGKTINVEYFDVPSGKPCYWFYFMNTPIGFNDIRVDGISTKTDSNTAAIEKKKNELCYSGNSHVMIRYSATIEELKRANETLARIRQWTRDHESSDLSVE